MALISQFSECPLCGAAIGNAADREIIATWHFIADRNDPLWRFSDAAMHYACFQRWPDRAVFVAKYNQIMGPRIWGDGTRHHMRDDGVIDCISAYG